MNKDIIPHNPQNPLQFDFDDAPIRIVQDADGEPLFVASDVCKALEITNVSHALSRLDDDEKDSVVLNDAVGRAHKITVVNEPGLYSLIGSSRKRSPQIKAFKRWIHHDVIPSIRKTGTYSVEAPSAIVPSEFDIIRKMLDAAERHAQQIAALEWQQDNLDNRVTKLEKRPIKGYSSVAAYLFEHKRNESPERIELLEEYALKLSSELGYEVLKAHGDVIVFHTDILKRLG